jgi:hypothetical protein
LLVENGQSRLDRKEIVGPTWRGRRIFVGSKGELTEDFGPILIASSLNPEGSTEGGRICTANPNKGGMVIATDARM